MRIKWGNFVSFGPCILLLTLVSHASSQGSLADIPIGATLASENVMLMNSVPILADGKTETLVGRESTTGFIVAAERYRVTSRNQGKRLICKIETMTRLGNIDGITPLYGWNIKEGLTLSLITQFAPLGTLEMYVLGYHRLQENLAASIIGQLLQSVAKAHERGFVHRGINSKAIRLTARGTNDDHPVRAMINGWGDGCFCGHYDRTIYEMRKCDVLAFLAPEIYLRENYPCDLKELQTIDIFALGSVLYQMVTGEMIVPCDKSNTAQMAPYHAMLRQAHFMAMYEHKRFSPELHDLIGRMLSFDPDARITAKQALTHAFITKYSKLDTLPRINPVLPEEASQLEPESQDVVQTMPIVSANLTDEANPTEGSGDGPITTSQSPVFY